MTRGDALERHDRSARIAASRPRSRDVLEDLNPLGVLLRDSEHGDRAVRHDEVEVAVEVRVDPRGAPARRPLCRMRLRQLRTRVRETHGRSPTAGCGTRRGAGLRELVTSRSGRPSRLKSAAAIPMPAFGSSTPASAPPPSKRKPSPRRRRLPARDVLVQLVRVCIVRHVQVEASVTVEVGEHGAEPVAEPLRLEAGGFPDLAERRAAVLATTLVQVEEIAHRMVVRRESGGRRRDRPVRDPCSPQRTDPGARRRSTSPTAAPACQPIALIPAACAPSVNDPSPSFQRSAS